MTNTKKALIALGATIAATTTILLVSPQQPKTVVTLRWKQVTTNSVGKLFPQAKGWKIMVSTNLVDWQEWTNIVNLNSNSVASVTVTGTVVLPYQSALLKVGAY